MPNEPLALAPPAAAPSEDDYQAFCAALSESERGRALLAEHARRNRQADTEALLTAIGRIEARSSAKASAVQRLRDDLRMLLIGIRLVRPEIEAAGTAAKAAKLAALLDLLERRIDAMAEARPPTDETPGAQVVPDAPAETARTHLTVVPPLDEPELPIPSSAGFEPRPVCMLDSALPTPNFVETPAPEPARQSPPDPLAAIMALSQDERLALFT